MDSQYNPIRPGSKQIWCPGCGLYMIFKVFIDVIKEKKWDYKDFVVVSGIGCTGRFAGYINADTMHTTHGRALVVAEGIKLANPNLNVIVVSGDGDIAGIGGNHLLHVSRRNTDITVICNANEIYGMTGGQTSPLTPPGVPTLTSLHGNDYSPVVLQNIVTSNNKYFFARSATFDIKHLKDMMLKAIDHKGFSFVEVRSPCITNYGRKLGYKNAGEMTMALKEAYKYQKDDQKLNLDEIGYVSKME